MNNCPTRPSGVLLASHRRSRVDADEFDVVGAEVTAGDRTAYRTTVASLVLRALGVV